MQRSYYSSYIRPHSSRPQQNTPRIPLRRIRIRPRLLIAIAALALLLLGGMLIASSFGSVFQEQAETARYQKLVEDAAADEKQSTRKADAMSKLLAENKEATAWLSIANTTINYPIAQATQAKPEFYLTHNLWKETNLVGCPYIDWRSSSAAQHILAFGHRTNLEQGMFSPLRLCHKQDEFDMLGDLTWEAREEPYTTIYKPLCAFKTEETNQRIQQFEFKTSSDFQTWLRALTNNASATSEKADKLIDTASRAITLVTCSEQRSGQSGRSVVIFVS